MLGPRQRVMPPADGTVGTLAVFARDRMDETPGAFLALGHYCHMQSSQLPADRPRCPARATSSDHWYLIFWAWPKSGAVMTINAT